MGSTESQPELDELEERDGYVMVCALVPASFCSTHIYFCRTATNCFCDFWAVHKPIEGQERLKNGPEACGFAQGPILDQSSEFA